MRKARREPLENRIMRLAERSGADVSLRFDDDERRLGRKGWSINLAWQRQSNYGPPNWWQEYVEGRTLSEAVDAAEKLVESARVQLGCELETERRAGLGPTTGER